MNSWCRSSSFYATPDDDDDDASLCSGCIEPLSSSSSSRMSSSRLGPIVVPNVSSFRQLIGSAENTICSNLPLSGAALFSFPVTWYSDRLYAPPPSFPSLRRTLLLSGHSAPTYSMFGQEVLSSQIPQRVDAAQRRSFGGLGATDEAPKRNAAAAAAAAAATDDRTTAIERRLCKATADGNIRRRRRRRRIKAKRRCDVNAQTAPPPPPSSSSSSSSSQPQMERRMFWTSLPPHPSPPISVCRRLTDVVDDNSSSADRSYDDNDDDDNNDDINSSSSSQATEDEPRDIERCTIRQDEISKSRDLVCPVCKCRLKRCQLESHLMKETEHLAYTRDGVTSSTPASTEVDSTTNSSSQSQVHVCREGNSSSCGLKVSSKLRYVTFLRIRSNRQSRLVHLRLSKKQDISDYKKSSGLTEPDFQITVSFNIL